MENPAKKGLKVQIELNVGTLPSSRTRIDCFIIEPESDRLTVSFPENQAEFLPYLTEGTEIRAFIYSLSGIMIVNSIVYDEPADGKMVIEFNEDHQTIQRRKYMRMQYATDLYIQKPEGNLKVETIDISGGGIRFRSSARFEKEKKVSAMLRLIKYEPMIKIEGVILKKSYFDEDEYVIEFTDITEASREKIVNKCKELEKQSKE